MVTTWATKTCLVKIEIELLQQTGTMVRAVYSYTALQ